MSPLGILLLVLGSLYYVRRRKLVALTAMDFPHVAPEQFEQWRRLEQRSIDTFLGVAAVLFLLGLIGAVAMTLVDASGGPAGPGIVIGMGALLGVNLLILLVGLTVSALQGSKAARLRKALGIDWPKRG